MKSQLIMRDALRVAIIAICIAGAGWFKTRPVAGQETKEQSLQGAAALDRLKQEGQLDSLRAAMNQARFGVSRADETPLGSAAWHAPNPAAALFTLPQKLTAADGSANDYFGYAVALSGDTAVVGARLDDIGANLDQGSAYVFTRSGGVWTLQQKLIADDGAAGDYFGVAVALSGDTAVVGADYDDGGANLGQGSAYVFTRNGEVWTQQQKLTASDGAQSDRFGNSVALYGDTLAIGADRAAIGANYQQGSVYVFTRIGAVWTLQQKITANDGASYDNFGGAVALSDYTLAVGVWQDDINGNLDQGSVYIFTRIGAVWSLQRKLFIGAGKANDYFGRAVALSGDTVVVGTPGDDNGASVNLGAAYVFTRSGTVWLLQQKLIANDGAVQDQFGYAVGLSGDTVAVGAPLDDLGANVDQGSAYVFTRSGEVWTLQDKLTPDDGAAGDCFGATVATGGDTVMVGAVFDDLGANVNQGSAYVFTNSHCPPLTFTPASFPDGSTNMWYQQSVTVSGGAGPYELAVTGGALPPGLSMTSNGLLSGTPPTPGAYQFTIRATDLSNSCSTSRVYTLSIQPPCYPLTLDPLTLPRGMRGAAYYEALTVIDGVYPFTFSKKGVLPPGLSLSLDGVISGVPTQTGAFTFTAIASDFHGCVGSRTYSIVITRPGIESNAARPER